MALPARHSGRFSRPAQATAAVLAVAALLVFVPVSGALPADTARAASSNDLTRELEDTRAELREVRANREKAENARKAALGDIAALDQSIATAEKVLGLANAARDAAAQELSEIRAELEQLTIELGRKEQELAQTESDLRRQQEIFNDRVANMYKWGGRLEYVGVLLEGGSLASVVGRIRLLLVVVEQDNNMLEQIKSLKQRVEEQRLALEEERGRVTTLEREQAALTLELGAVASQREASLEELESAREAKRKVLAAAEKDRAAWAKQEDRLLAESDRIAEQLRATTSAKPVKAGKGVLSWPLDGEVTSGFGYRVHPIFHVRKMHTGIDIDGDTGDPIRAAAVGKVVSAGWRGGYGKCVVISHSGGLATLYAHQSEILVSVGESVERGEVIGKVGSTGYSTGPHLHFEVRVNGSPVDPLGYL